MKISACMCISRGDYEKSLESLLKNNPDEILIAAKDKELKKGIETKYPEARVVIKEREKPWDNYGKYDLYDMASGDWIIVLNDDDYALTSYREHLKGVSQEVGFCFGDSVKREIVRNNEKYSKYSIKFMECNYYALRKKCWEDIEESMDTEIIIHDEARTMYWALKKGYKYHYVDKSVVKNTVGESSTKWGFYSPFWDYVYQVLEDNGDTKDWLLKWNKKDFLRNKTKYMHFLKNMATRGVKKAIKRRWRKVSKGDEFD